MSQNPLPTAPDLSSSALMTPEAVHTTWPQESHPDTLDLEPKALMSA